MRLYIKLQITLERDKYSEVLQLMGDRNPIAKADMDSSDGQFFSKFTLILLKLPDLAHRYVQLN